MQDSDVIRLPPRYNCDIFFYFMTCSINLVTFLSPRLFRSNFIVFSWLLAVSKSLMILSIVSCPIVWFPEKFSSWVNFGTAAVIALNPLSVILLFSERSSFCTCCDFHRKSLPRFFTYLDTALARSSFTPNDRIRILFTLLWLLMNIGLGHMFFSSHSTT